MAVGMSTGLLSIRQRMVRSTDLDIKNKRNDIINGGTLRHFNRGQQYEPDDDIFIESKRKKRLQPYEKALKSFRYGDALDAALTMVIFTAIYISIYILPFFFKKKRFQK